MNQPTFLQQLIDQPLATVADYYARHWGRSA
jgi:hypothetical protein